MCAQPRQWRLCRGRGPAAASALCAAAGSDTLAACGCSQPHTACLSERQRRSLRARTAAAGAPMRRLSSPPDPLLRVGPWPDGPSRRPPSATILLWHGRGLRKPSLLAVAAGLPVWAQLRPHGVWLRPWNRASRMRPPTGASLGLEACLKKAACQPTRPGVPLWVHCRPGECPRRPSVGSLLLRLRRRRNSAWRPTPSGGATAAQSGWRIVSRGLCSSWPAAKPAEPGLVSRRRLHACRTAGGWRPSVSPMRLGQWLPHAAPASDCLQHAPMHLCWASCMGKIVHAMLHVPT
jgi:hypothetical protein